MVELRDVHYRVGGAHIVRGVSLAFRARKFNVILGPNGAGKSTLLKLATGLLDATEGDVTYGGEAVTEIGVAALARRRAVLSQHVELAFPLPVDDVVMMGRYPHFARVPSHHDREIVAQALELVEMTAFRARSYPTLSGGEQQKVQLARVLAQIWTDDAHPGEKYLFLDEPTSNLDVYYELHLLEAARALLARGCTVIAILHDINQALRYGDAFFVLEHGRLAHEGDDASAISAELIERVFRVRARVATDADSGDTYWHFDSAR
ncbi:MAG: heme ABC transporter ATP-binding protein [Gemmatimonadaceae bacterium]